MLLRTQCHGFAAAVTTLLTAGDPLLGLLQRPLRFAVIPGVLGGYAVGGDEKHL
jgi:hypothetical protein